MARITLTQSKVVFNEGTLDEYSTDVKVDVAERSGFLLNDLDKRQQMREHTVYPPGQECYLRPIDVEALDAYLDSIGATPDAAALLAATVAVDDISIATIDGLTGIDADQAAVIQDMLSLKLIETGNMLLSFDGGVIAKLLTATDGAGNPVVKVFTDAGDALFSL